MNSTSFGELQMPSPRKRRSSPLVPHQSRGPKRWASASAWGFLCLTIGLLLTACQAPTPSVSGPTPSSVAIATDPCAVRLDDINGALLLYYTLNKQLPENLEQIRPLADDGAALNFTCPLSQKPYTYLPVNPDVPVSEPCLILFDSTPAHRGLRWGILATPAKDKQPVTFTVIQLDEAALRTYHVNPAP